MTEPHLKLLEEMKDSPYAKALSAFVQEEIDKINTVKGIKTLEEALGKEYAVNLLEKMFNFLNRKNSTNDKNQYS